MRRISLFLILTIFVLSCKNEKKEYDELSIYNDLLDSLYNIEYCHRPMIAPNNRPDLLDKNSTQYKEYVLLYEDKMNEFHNKLDSMDLILIMKDSLLELNLELDKKILLRELAESDSLFIRLLNKTNNIPSKKIELNRLKQSNIKFKNKTEIDSTFRCEYGINNNDFLIGSISLSRILLDEKQNIGILKFGFIGGCSCGYGVFVFIQKDGNNKWEIVKTVNKWVS